MLARLRPLGVTPSGVEVRPQTLGRLRSMLTELVRGWAGPGQDGRHPAIELRIDEGRDAQPLAQELALGLYRITQEALTNVMRHAGATRCEVEISVRADARHGTVVAWRVADDGRGIEDLDAALCRGTGLAGLKDRVWTLGGRFTCTTAGRGQGTELRAEFHPAEGDAS